MTQLSPSDFKKGEYVYTCPECGREGEENWMNEHLKLAHGIKSAKKRHEMMRYCPARKEYARMRQIPS